MINIAVRSIAILAELKKTTGGMSFIAVATTAMMNGGLKPSLADLGLGQLMQQFNVANICMAAIATISLAHGAGAVLSAVAYNLLLAIAEAPEFHAVGAPRREGHSVANILLNSFAVKTYKDAKIAGVMRPEAIRVLDQIFSTSVIAAMESQLSELEGKEKLSDNARAAVRSNLSGLSQVASMLAVELPLHLVKKVSEMSGQSLPDGFAFSRAVPAADFAAGVTALFGGNKLMIEECCKYYSAPIPEKVQAMPFNEAAEMRYFVQPTQTRPSIYGM